MNKTLKIVLGAVYVLVLGLLSFLYRFITDFPIGDDPAIHASKIKTVSYVGLLSTDYPIPLFIYKLLHQISGIPAEKLFVILICSFLFLAGLAVWLLAKKISGSNLIAVFSSLIFVTSYWTFDGLRMGLLPETFGWLILALTLYFLASQSLVWLTVFSILLPLSHPYSFAVYVLIFILYGLITIIFGQKKEKQFIWRMILIYLAIIILAVIIRPTLLTKFSGFVNPEVIGWGERNFFVWLTASQKRRIFLAVFAIIGIVSSLKNIKDFKFRLLYLVLFVGMFMAMNQYFGIRFQVFRFSPYLELPLAIFAALGIGRVVEIFELKRSYKYLGILALSAIILLPQIYANERVTYGMSKIAENNNSMSEADQAAIAWIGQNVAKDAVIQAPYKWRIWITALTNHQNFVTDEAVYTVEIWGTPESYSGDYLYWPTAIYPLSKDIREDSRLEKVFEQDKTIIFKVKK
ncbi:MAG: hypothetical protein WC451_03800 [Patescibacteria group bacterium]